MFLKIIPTIDIDKSLIQQQALTIPLQENR